MENQVKEEVEISFSDLLKHAKQLDEKLESVNPIEMLKRLAHRVENGAEVSKDFIVSQIRGVATKLENAATDATTEVKATAEAVSQLPEQIKADATAANAAPQSPAAASIAPPAWETPSETPFASGSPTPAAPVAAPVWKPNA